MAWKIVHNDAEGVKIQEFPVHAQKGQKVYLVQEPGTSWIVPVPISKPIEDSTVIGSLGIDPWGGRLQALHGNSLTITPEHPLQDADINPPSEQYVLRSSADARSEIILLRNKDVLKSPRCLNAQFVFTWDPEASKVQVNSSVSQHGETAVRDAEEETEDEDLDQTVRTIRPSHSTPPLPSAARTEVVQETPISDRVATMTNLPLAAAVNQTLFTAPKEHTDFESDTTGENLAAGDAKVANGKDDMSNSDDDEFKTASQGYNRKTANGKDTVSPTDVKDATKTPNRKAASSVSSTSANRRSHPTVVINAKRSDPEAEDVQTIPTRPAKRKKTEGAAKTTPKSTRKSVSKGKRRLSDANEVPQATPSRSQRLKQSVVDDSDFTFDPPRVAFSNSTINETGQHVKFLKKHGGVIVDDVSNKCNILCVKEGPLVKTMKLLQSIALGIPVVTDKWLLDSSKDGRLLALADYIPSAPQQEKEWKCNLSAIWNTPQNTLFNGYTIHFTPALKAAYKDFAEIEKVCKAAGVKKVVSKKLTAKDAAAEQTIVLGAAEGDDVEVLGEKMCFGKDFLTNSILRGQVDISSNEFAIVRKA